GFFIDGFSKFPNVLVIFLELARLGFPEIDSAHVRLLAGLRRGSPGCKNQKERCNGQGFHSWEAPSEGEDNSTRARAGRKMAPHLRLFSGGVPTIGAQPELRIGYGLGGNFVARLWCPLPVVRDVKGA